MKRETLANRSYIDYLKSIGCRFYAPLKEDIRDHITETEAIVQGSQGTFTEDGYQFSACAVIWSSGYWQQLTYESEFTMILDYRRTGNLSGNGQLMWNAYAPNEFASRCFCFTCPSGDYNTMRCGLQLNYGSYSVFEKNNALIGEKHVKTGFQYDGHGVLNLVQDGIVREDVKINAGTKLFNDWSMCPMCLGGVINYSADRWNGTIGNVLLFDQKLTQEQIDSI